MKFISLFMHYFHKCKEKTANNSTGNVFLMINLDLNMS